MSSSVCGMTLDNRPALTCRQSVTIELVSSVGWGVLPTDPKMRSTIRRFCMSGLKRHSGTSAASDQVTLSRPANGPSSGVSRM